MRKMFAAACTAAFVLASCQEESFEGRPDPDNYYAAVEIFGTDTRTALGEGRSVVWSSEDRIAIFEGNGSGQAYQVLDAYVGKSSGEFAEVEGLVAEGTGASLEGTIAVYPFNEDLSVTSGDNGDYIIEGISFPAEQKYIAGSFSDEAFPMTAVCENGSRNLSFKNIGGVLKLSLTGNNSVSQITLTGNSGEPLSGSATVTLGSDGIPSVTMSDDASTSVSLICDPAVQLDPETAADFYISIPPTDFEAGFKVTILDGEGKEHGLATHKTNPAERSSILAMPESTPESMDDIELTADTFCSVDFIEGWTETRFGGDGTIVFVKEDEQGRMTHSLMFLPDKENILMPVYIRYDENEIPSYMSFMDTEIYIDGYTDSTVDFTLAVEDAVWSIKDVPCNELMPYSLQTRAWSDNNAIRNACAIGELIVGVAGVAGGVVMISASGIGEVMTAGASTPISVAGIALGVMNIGGGCDSIAGSLETIFGPAEQKQSTYVKDGLMGIGKEKLSDWIRDAPKKDYIKKILPAHLLKDPADLRKLGTITYWSGFIFSSIDEEWGETYTGPVNLAQVHQDVKVVTGRADNITKDSAELYGYVSPVATAPFGDRVITEIYIVVWKAGDENNKQNRSIFNSDGGTVSLKFIDLEPDTEYCYQTIFEDLDNKIYRFGEVKTFKTKGDDCTLREQLIKLYHDTDGDNWTNNDNWCSDRPIEEWYGIRKYDGNYYTIYLRDNNLKGSFCIKQCKLLTSIDVSWNQLTSIDVTGCANLFLLHCYDNELSSIDISGCDCLDELDCSFNRLSSLDISSTKLLQCLSCGANLLTTLNVQGNLMSLYCSLNQLSTLNVSECTYLEALDCSYNQLSSLNVSGCACLEKLDCSYNQLSSLDISGLKSLEKLDFNNNQMQDFNLSKCENIRDLSIKGNPGISVKISDCASLNSTRFSGEELTLLHISKCPNLPACNIDLSQILSLELSDLSTDYDELQLGKNIKSLTISNWKGLRRIVCSESQLESLIISNCPDLLELECEHNLLTELSTSGFPNLKSLSCWDNLIQSLDVSGLTNLTNLGCGGNPIKYLDVSGLTNLTNLTCGTKTLKSIDASSTGLLNFSYGGLADGIALTLQELNLSNCKDLKYLSVTGLELEKINITGCSSLEQAYLSNNNLTSLDIAGCNSLSRLDCEKNKIIQLITPEFEGVLFKCDWLYYYYHVPWKDNIPCGIKYDINDYGWYYSNEPDGRAGEIHKQYHD